MIKFTIGKQDYGLVLAAESSKGLCAVILGDDKEELIHQLTDFFPREECIEVSSPDLLKAVVNTKTPYKKAMDIRGTPFQQKVWKALCAIPVGETATYSDIAKKIGAPKAVRAVAGACAANKIALVIPCHRVIRNDGTLSGYRWGVEKKADLLDIELQIIEG